MFEALRDDPLVDKSSCKLISIVMKMFISHLVRILSENLEKSSITRSDFNSLVVDLEQTLRSFTEEDYIEHAKI